MKVLLTGGAGFIGSHIIDKLLQENYDIVVVDNLSSGSLENLPQSEKIKFYQKDIFLNDLTELFEIEKPEYCIHLAAQTSVIKSVNEPVYDAQMNIISTLNLLHLCKKYNIKRFIAASTAAVYGTPKHLPIEESHPTEPISYYGLSKLTMEKYIQLSNIPYTIFRFANVYGPRQASSQESGVVAIFNDKMLNNEPINIFGDGNQIRDFVYVEDIAQACVSSLKNNNTINQVLNYSTSIGVTINELFNLMKDIYNCSQDVNYLPARAGDIKDSILSNKKAAQTISTTTFTPIKEGIKKLRDYYEKERIVNA